MSDFVSDKESKTSNVSIIKLFLRALWTENPGLCQILGLCPLLAVTSTATSALGLGIATIIVIVISSVLISLMRFLILREVRIPLYVVLIATMVTVIRFYAQAYYPDLYDQLGIYLALIVTNCVIMGRAEAFAGKNGAVRSFADALGNGTGFTLVLIALGSIREILGSGTWFAGAHNLLGNWALPLETTVLDKEFTFMIAVLPPGGFFVLAMLIALQKAHVMHKRNKEENRFKIKFSRD